MSVKCCFKIPALSQLLKKEKDFFLNPHLDHIELKRVPVCPKDDGSEKNNEKDPEEKNFSASHWSLCFFPYFPKVISKLGVRVILLTSV